jgi:hypothetical protein
LVVFSVVVFSVVDFSLDPAPLLVSVVLDEVELSEVAAGGLASEAGAPGTTVVVEVVVSFSVSVPLQPPRLANTTAMPINRAALLTFGFMSSPF